MAGGLFVFAGDFCALFSFGCRCAALLGAVAPQPSHTGGSQRRKCGSCWFAVGGVVSASMAQCYLRTTGFCYCVNGFCRIDVLEIASLDGGNRRGRDGLVARVDWILI